MSISARFEVAFSRFLAPEGNVEQELPPFARERDAVLRLYRAMVLTRSFDTRAVALQPTVIEPLRADWAGVTRRVHGVFLLLRHRPDGAW